MKGRLTKLHNKELHFLSNIILMIKSVSKLDDECSTRVKWRKCIQGFGGKTRGEDIKPETSIDKSIIL